jgi:hypothetical protein
VAPVLQTISKPRLIIDRMASWPGFIRLMESNISDQRISGSESQLAEPHFDEEATLLSARAVVPLEKVSAKARLNRPWLFALALAGALFLGAAATAIYYSRLNNREVRPQANVDTSSSNVQSTQSDEPAGVLNESQAIAGGSALDSGRADGSAKAEPEEATSPVSSTTSRNTKDEVARRPTHTPTTIAERSNRKAEIREELRAARREARKRNRQLGQERRAAKNSDDLLRIREIFEGSPRP